MSLLQAAAPIHEHTPSASRIGVRRGKGFGSRTFYIGLAVGIYAVLVAMMFVRVRHANQGHFVFALDDPYIHLALASELHHGHYGLNAGEAASPSSSLLWPLLIAPFAQAEWAPYGALVLNALAGLLTAVLLGVGVDSWSSTFAEADERWRRSLAIVLLVFVGNLVGLTFLGMEHTLQVLLATAVALGVIRCLQRQLVPWWAIGAAVIGPSVRYEALALTMALAVCLIAEGRRRLAAGVIAASLMPLALFALFLHHLGLPPVPTSVMVKGGLQVQHTGFVSRLFDLLSGAVGSMLQPDHTLLAVLFLTLCGLAWSEPDQRRRLALAGAALAAGLHLAIGRFGWFHRYEVYVVLFSTLVLLHVLSERPRMLLGWFALGLITCAAPYIDAWRTTIAGTRDTYLMQAQMRRFSEEYVRGHIAVNDLGLVSYHHRANEYILDLAGLGSVEAARQVVKDPAWLDEVTARHQVELAMVFRTWFPRVPQRWAHLGALCLVNRPQVLPESCTQFYAVNPARQDELQRAFDRFALTLPQGVVAVRPADSEVSAASGAR